MFQWRWELFPFSPVLFIVLITHGYTDKIFLSVYSNGDGNSSLLKVLIIKAFLINKITNKIEISMRWQLMLFFFYCGTCFLMESPKEWEFQGTSNKCSFLLLIIYSFTDKITDGMNIHQWYLEGFLKFFTWIENSNLTS
jgi:hypothetical protein